MYANFDMNIAAPTSVVILMCEYLLKFINMCSCEEMLQAVALNEP